MGTQLIDCCLQRHDGSQTEGRARPGLIERIPDPNRRERAFSRLRRFGKCQSRSVGRGIREERRGESGEQIRVEWVGVGDGRRQEREKERAKMKILSDSEADDDVSGEIPLAFHLERLLRHRPAEEENPLWRNSFLPEHLNGDGMVFRSSKKSTCPNKQI